MPEATVDENHFLSRGKDDIGFAWKAGLMQSVTVSESIQESSDNHLGLVLRLLTDRMI